MNLQTLYGLQVRGRPFSLGGSLFWGAVGAFRSGVGLAVCRFLCVGRYIALLIEHEWGGPHHTGHGGVKLPGILFMTWRAQGVMSSWLLVFLFTICCHKPR